VLVLGLVLVLDCVVCATKTAVLEKKVPLGGSMAVRRKRLFEHEDEPEHEHDFLH